MQSMRSCVKFCILTQLKRTHTERLFLKTMMTTPVFCAEEAIERLKTNPHYDKYAAKISQLQRTNPEDLVQRLEQVHLKKFTGDPKEQTEGRPFSEAMEAKADKDLTVGPMHSKGKALHDIMRTELILHKSPAEIQQIWEEYHVNKEVLAATIPTEQYYRITLRSRQFPVFLFPLPRGQGYEYILCQFSGNEVHFTPLISYQAHKENAPECLTLVHYIELQELGVILMRGEYNKDVLNATEAQCLANQLQLYYCNPDEKRMKLLERFTKAPDQFQHVDLIAELESLSM